MPLRSPPGLPKSNGDAEPPSSLGVSGRVGALMVDALASRYCIRDCKADNSCSNARLVILSEPGSLIVFPLNPVVEPLRRALLGWEGSYMGVAPLPKVRSTSVAAAKDSSSRMMTISIRIVILSCHEWCMFS